MEEQRDCPACGADPTVEHYDGCPVGARQSEDSANRELGAALQQYVTLAGMAAEFASTATKSWIESNSEPTYSSVCELEHLGHALKLAAERIGKCCNDARALRRAASIAANAWQGIGALLLVVLLASCSGVHAPSDAGEACGSLTSWTACGLLEHAADRLPDEDGMPIPGGCLVACPWPTALGPGECPYEAHGTCARELCDPVAVEACYRLAVRENNCESYARALELCERAACR